MDAATIELHAAYRAQEHARIQFIEHLRSILIDGIDWDPSETQALAMARKETHRLFMEAGKPFRR